MISEYLKKNKKDVFVIAEAGVNHNGDIKNAYKLIDIAKDCGADAVKFQTWKKGEITGKYTGIVDYIKKNLKQNKLSRYSISEKYRLSYNEFIKLKKYSEKNNIILLSTPDGIDSLHFCVKKLKIPAIKIGSSELNNYEFLRKVSICNRDVILSTGMGNFNEIKKAIKIINSNLNKENTLYVLQCTSEYPAPIYSININAMIEIKKKFKVMVGLSDHSEGNLASILACSNGAKIIEKHFTINKSMKGPDHKASLNPSALKKFIRNIRDIPIIMGSKEKKPSFVELKNIPNVRRGVVAKFKIKKGTLLNKNLLTTKRPFIEIQPEEINKLYNKRTLIDLEEDQPIKWEFIDE